MFFIRSRLPYVNHEMFVEIGPHVFEKSGRQTDRHTQTQQLCRRCGRRRFPAPVTSHWIGLDYLGDECGGDEVRVGQHCAVSGDGHVQLTGVRHERHAERSVI